MRKEYYGMVKQLVDRFCIYCGSKENLTKDHIPPRCIFASPRPTNLISVPACETCNGSFKRDDEYFRAFVTSEATHDSPACRRVWEEGVMGRTLTRSPRLKARLRSQLGKANLYSKGGIFIGHVPTLRFEKKRINPVLERIVKGLYWHHKGKRIDPSAEFIFFKDAEIEGPMVNAVRFAKWQRIGRHDEFTYGFVIAPDHIAISVWFFVFFGKTFLMGVVGPKGWFKE